MKDRAPRHHKAHDGAPRVTDVEAGARALRAGDLVVFPTETVYGLGANALDAGAVGKIFAVKGRPADNPLIVHLFERGQLATLVAELPETALRLFDAFSPGPLTLVLPVAPEVPRAVTAGLATVAVRFPRHTVARELLRRCRVPVAAPSANRSGEPSPTTLAMSRESLGSRVRHYIDGGPCEVGLESTVAACQDRRVTILRPGAVTASDIRDAVPGVEIVHAGGLGAGAVPRGDAPPRTAPPPSPGMKHRHYQPSVPVLVWGNTASGPRETGGGFLPFEEMVKRGDIGVICERGGELASRIAGGSIPQRLVRRYANLDEYARMLYFWFYELDREQPEAIIAQMPAREGIGMAIADRLSRAASGEVSPER